ncbi:MAG: hypothetical protein ABFC38_10945 [Methanospirillum sp.]
MATSRSPCVIDTSVLIDLDQGAVLRSFFSLPFRFIVPDLLLAELKRPDPSSLTTLGLEVVHLTGEEVRRISEIRAEIPRLSAPDTAAFVTAEAHGSLLLTGDARLRDYAEEHGVAVHGTLWALDRLYDEGKITGSLAAFALRRMRENGSRLPEGECSVRLKRWDSDDKRRKPHQPEGVRESDAVYSGLARRPA